MRVFQQYTFSNFLLLLEGGAEAITLDYIAASIIRINFITPVVRVNTEAST